VSEIRVALAASRSAVAEDHLWAASDTRGARSGAAIAGVTPALLDAIPVAEAYVIVVPAERVAFRRVAFPAGPRAKAMAAVPFLLEDGLIEPPEHYEFFVLDESAKQIAGSVVNVAVLERDWLAAARLALARIDRGEVRWVVEGWGWPSADGVWQLRIDERGALLAQGGPTVVRMPLANLEAMLDLALGDPAAPKPAALEFDAAADPAAGDRLRAWAERRGIAARRVVLPDAWRTDCAQSPWTLFRQSRSHTRQAWRDLATPSRWRAVAWGVAALAAVELLGLLAGWAVLEARVSASQKESVELFRSVAGPNAAIVDPLLQMRRLHRAQAHREGSASEDDFLPLLAAVGEALPREFGRIGEMGFEDGRLRLVIQRTAAAGAAASVAGPGTSALDAAVQRLRRGGFRVDAVASPDATRWTLSVGRS
jgi:general secretion pathway protein L